MPNSADISWLKAVHLAPRERREQERLLLVMHGLGDSLEGFRFLSEVLRIPGLHYLLVNAPDRYFTGFSWFDIYGGDAKAGIQRSRDLLVATLDELFSQGWTSGQIGLLGFSQGCLMAMDLACRFPQAFGAVVGISGFVGLLEEYPEKLSAAARSQKILVTHGSQDPVLPLSDTRPQIQALQGMGLSIDWRVYEKEHTVDPRQEVQDIRTFLVRNLMR